MEKIGRKELIKKYIEFFKSKGHKEIPNASLIPENDPTILFTTAGMQPLVPYLLGQKHPLGRRLVNVQKCIRTTDIEEVGDTCHHTFFEQLGNWSLGDYFKKEAIEYFFEFLTKELKIPKEKLSASVFNGNKDAQKDIESYETLISLGFSKSRIKFLPKSENWWGPAGKTGPCGPDSEIFYWTSEKPAPKEFNPEDKNWIELGNNVFMQYNQTPPGKYESLKQNNVDFGGGSERILAVLEGYNDNYLTNSFKEIIKKIEKLSGKKYGKNEKETQHMRIIADHIKASVFIIADGIIPSNVEAGYVVRRLIRRAIRYGHIIGMKNFIEKIAEPVFEIYDDYEILKKNKEKILEELRKEEEKFEKTLEEGLITAKKILSNKISIKKEKIQKIRNLAEEKTAEIMRKMIINKKNNKDYSIKEASITKEEIANSLISGEEAFYLYQSFGFPRDMILDLAINQNLLVDLDGFDEELTKHQELSRTASAGQFKSGLADNSEKTTKLHTATHLLNQALREVLHKPDLHQKGSNITAERLRFDFNFDRKLSEEEIRKVEEIVNKKIKEKCEVKREEISVQEAKKAGAQGIFDSKYGDKVSVYSVGDFSKEICAGPHVENTCVLGKFRIIKEESSASGVRRIKAVLELT